MRTLPLWFLLWAACEPAGPTPGSASEICGNLADDDENGLVDCEDPACVSTCNEICNDGLDNDGDALVDCADDGCDGLCPEVCDDGRDNDADGSVDCADLDCFGSCPEVCDDGRDNDADGRVDCLDEDCNLPSCPESCADGRDNDADGLVDCLDDSCDGQCPEDCLDGRDNDGNGRADCDDPACDGDCPEVCDDGRDNDADGQVDCDDDECAVFCDQDEDGFLNEAYGGDDCDDTRPDVNPARPEVCSGVDDDCDGLVDEEDPTLDALTLTAFYLDRDEDGYGAGADAVLACFAPAGRAPGNLDCDDRDPAVYPSAPEVCDGADNDCDDLTDEDDPSLDLSTMITWYRDMDADGYGVPGSTFEACTAPIGYAPNPDDCDDRAPQVGPPSLWYPDADADGFGDDSSPPADPTPSCEAPAAGLAPDWRGLDCDDGRRTIYPGAFDECEDGIDQDCDGLDAPCVRGSCLEWLEYDSRLPSGVYAIQPDPSGPEYEIWCDMDTDGGGWTLVAATRTTTMNDEAMAWHSDLTTLVPSAARSGVWDGLRPLISDRSDLRFTCKRSAGDPTMNVDLSFYNVIWYREITAGADSATCFVENNGVGEERPIPARRNNLTAASLPEGDPWNAGYLEGEDSCGDTSDFTVDFDDRGMDSNESDGTDWGEDDGSRKCGTSGTGDAWFIFARER